MEAPGFYTTSPSKDQEMDERLFASTANLRRLAVDGTVCPEFGFGVATKFDFSRWLLFIISAGTKTKEFCRKGGGAY